MFTFANHRSRTKHRAQRCVTVLLIALGLNAPQINAQTEMTLLYGGSAPTFSTVDLEALFRTVALTSDQAEIITSIHAGYQDAHRAIYQDTIEQTKDLFATIKEETSPQRREALSDDIEFVRQVGREQCRDIEIAFTNDIKALLDQGQLALYQQFERDRRRRLTLRIGPVFKGENIDLASLADSLEPTVRASINPVLQRYALELDPILLQRNRMIEQVQSTSTQARIKDAPDEVQNMLDDSLNLHLAVRDAHWRWMDQVSATLDHAHALDWQRQFYMTGWSRTISRTRADETFDKAQGLPTLVPNQREVLERIRTSFKEQITPVERQIVELERQQDKQQKLDPDAESDLGERIARLLNQRTLIVDDYIIQIHGILSPAQKTELQAARTSPSTFALVHRYNIRFGQYGSSAVRCPVKEFA